jgi:hypothetical protein
LRQQYSSSIAYSCRFTETEVSYKLLPPPPSVFMIATAKHKRTSKAMMEKEIFALKKQTRRCCCGGNRRYSYQVTGRTNSNPSRDKKYHTSCRAHPASCTTGTGLLSRELSSRGCDAYSSPASAVEVKNEWHCTCVLSVFLCWRLQRKCYLFCVPLMLFLQSGDLRV